MAHITAENVRHVANSINEIFKKVVIDAMNGENEDDQGPVAKAREKEDDAQHDLAQGVLDYKYASSNRTYTSKDDDRKAITKAHKNAAKSRTALQRRQSYQFGILTDLFACSHNLATQQPIFPLSPALPDSPLVADPALVSVVTPWQHNVSAAFKPLSGALSVSGENADASEDVE
ncbi:unnamed protein product [Agarophyton chilense]